MIQGQKHRFIVTLACFIAALLMSCTPRVEVRAPAEPITINLNVKIDHEVKVKVQRDLDELIAEEDDLF